MSKWAWERASARCPPGVSANIWSWRTGLDIVCLKPGEKKENFTTLIKAGLVVVMQW